MKLKPELLTDFQVRKLLGMAKSTFYDFLQTTPDFPAARYLGRRKRWLRKEIKWYLDHLPTKEVSNGTVQDSPEQSGTVRVSGKRGQEA